jgi:hypothetical protein
LQVGNHPNPIISIFISDKEKITANRALISASKFSKMTTVLFVFLLVILLAGSSEAFSSVSRLNHRESLTTAAEASTGLQEQDSTSRAKFLSSLLSMGSSCLLVPLSAGAEVDPALKGTKKDPSFEACLSKCMYECTKPKGAEQKSRAECLPECKKSCAKSKEQLMLGLPIKKAID